MRLYATVHTACKKLAACLLEACRTWASKACRKIPNNFSQACKSLYKLLQACKDCYTLVKSGMFFNIYTNRFFFFFLNIHSIYICIAKNYKLVRACKACYKLVRYMASSVSFLQACKKPLACLVQAFFFTRRLYCN